MAHLNHIKQARRFEKQGNYVQALDSYQQALAQSPGDLNIIFSLGNIARKLEMYDTAEQMYRTVLASEPASSEALSNLGLCYSEAKRFDEAIEVYQNILSSEPENADAWLNLGNIMKATWEIDKAITFYEECMRLDPKNSNAICNYAFLRKRSLPFDEIRALFNKAKKIDKKNPEIRAQFGEALLLNGNLKEAWIELKFARQIGKIDNNIHHHKLRTWQGESLKSKTILVSSEQGLGDQLRHMNCMEDLITKARQVVFETDPRLVKLIARTYPEISVKPYDHKRIGIAHNFYYDWPVDKLNCTIRTHDVFGYFRNNFEDFPPAARKILVEPKDQEKWSKRVNKSAKGLKIGLCWSGGHKLDERQSHYLEIEDLEDILKIKDVTFYSLMYTNSVDDIARAKEMFGVDIQHYPDIDYKNDLDDVFALTQQMDVVVTVNSAPGIIADALHIPTLMLMFDLFQFSNPKDGICPLTPFTRPFRYTRPAGWQPPVSKIAKEIENIKIQKTNKFK